MLTLCIYKVQIENYFILHIQNNYYIYLLNCNFKNIKYFVLFARFIFNFEIHF